MIAQSGGKCKRFGKETAAFSGGGMDNCGRPWYNYDDKVYFPERRKETALVFTSIVFLLFFLPALLVLYYLPYGRMGMKMRNAVLLLFSLGFYAWGGVRYLAVLLLSVMINYFGALAVGKMKDGKIRTAVFACFVILNFLLLGYYKYLGFAADTLGALGIGVTVPSVVLPIGISFFTFQGASYLIDVYRRDVVCQTNPVCVALYVSLFPQLVAGPIVRYTTVENEIMSRSHSLGDFSDGLVRFMLGFGKKLLLANAMGKVADGVFASVGGGMNSIPLAWVGAIAYSFQIYFDFSAYSDMAIGLGRMFGFHFLENFNYPYIASSVTDFWRRWHISLSSWFRDYLYIPLGGNRCGKPRQIFNLLVVWGVTGLWHGANMTFVLWGLYFGVLLILEKFVFARILPRIPSAVRHILTLIAVIIGWVLFRSDTVADAGHYLRTMFGGGVFDFRDAVYYIREYAPEFVLSVIASFPITAKLKEIADAKRGTSKPVFLAETVGVKIFAAAVFVLSFARLVSDSFNPFIYFQF